MREIGVGAGSGGMYFFCVDEIELCSLMSLCTSICGRVY